MKKLLTILFFCCITLISGAAPMQVQQSRPAGEKEMVIQVIGNRITIQNATPNAIVEIYSILGVKLKQYVLPQPDEEYVIELPKGCYILKSENMVRKIAIK